MMWELADEADRVGDERRPPVGAHHLARRRVERGEQAVFDQHVRPGERVEERALPGVGVADQRGAEIPSAARTLGLALALDAAEMAAQHRDPLAHAAPVDLELGLARAARA